MDMIGVDVGRSSIKAVGWQKRLFGLPMVSKLPQQGVWRDLDTLNRVVERDGVIRLNSLLMGYGGQEYLVGEYGEEVGLRAVHPMMVTKGDKTTRLLVLAALVGLDAAEGCQVCVGVPMQDYAQQAERLGRLLPGSHEVTVDGSVRTFILRGMVVPEGLGLLVRAALSGEEPDRSLLKVPTVVMDFGHRTVQAAVFFGLRMVGAPYVSAHGIYELWEEVLIEEVEGPEQTVFESPHRAIFMDRLVRDGRLVIRGTEVTLEALKPKLLARAADRWERICAEITRALAGVQYGRVVAGGGGVSLFAPLFKELVKGDVVVLEDRFAQAEGYRLLLEYRKALEEA